MQNKDKSENNFNLLEIIQEIQPNDLVKIIRNLLKECGLPPLVAVLASKLLVKALTTILDKWREEFFSIASTSIEYVHEKLKTFPVYRILTANIIEKLFIRLMNARKENTIQDLLHSALTNENIFEEFEKEFDSLTDEQKILVLSNKELQKEIQKISGDIDQILYLIRSIKEPNFQLQLVDDGEYVPEIEGSAHWFSYKANKSIYIEREEEKIIFNRFIHSERRFLFLAIEGQGGIGKNRFVYEEIKSLLKEWEAGFCVLDHQEIKKLNTWIPDKPHLLVVDYAAEKVKEVTQLLSILASKSGFFAHPFRVVLLERNTSTEAKLFGHKNWWDEILNVDMGNLRRYLFQDKELYSDIYKDGVLTMLGLSGQKLIDVFEAWLVNFSHTSTPPPLEDKGFWRYLEMLVDGGRPLFVGMAAYIYASSGREELLSSSLRDVFNCIFIKDERHFLNKAQDQLAYEQVKKMNILSIFCGGLNTSDEFFQEIIGTLGLEHNRNETIRLAREFAGNMNMQIQPDLLAEYFILRWMNCEDDIYLSEDEKKLIRLGFKYGKNKFVFFFYRFVNDYPCAQGNKSITKWLNFIASMELTEKEIEEFIMLLLATSFSKGDRSNIEHFELINSYFCEILEKYCKSEIAIAYIIVLAKGISVYSDAGVLDKVKELIGEAKALYFKFESDEGVINAYATCLLLSIFGTQNIEFYYELENLHVKHVDNENVSSVYSTILTFSLQSYITSPYIEEISNVYKYVSTIMDNLEFMHNKFDNLLITNNYLRGLIAVVLFYKKYGMSDKVNATLKTLNHFDISVADKETIMLLDAYKKVGIIPCHILT